jgi:membrane dipeptidase
MMPIIDGHNDLPMQLRARYGYSVAGLGETSRPELQTDLPRLRAGRVGAQFWSAYVPSDLPEPEAVVATLEQVDAIYRLAAAYPSDFVMAFTADDVERAWAGGRIASLIGLEGGHSLGSSLGVLRMFARLGVRYVTLTHNNHTSWADSAAEEPRLDGLNDAGRAVVLEMQRLGVLVDLAHVATATMHAALDTAIAPVIFSHSGVRALNDHNRNVPDDVLSRLRGNGGVIQLTFVAPFVSPASRAWFQAANVQWQRLALQPTDGDWPRAPFPGEDPASVPAWPADERWSHPGIASWLSANPRPVVTVAEVADHVEHARDVAGVDHIGLGGDFDGTTELPEGLDDVSGYPRLFDELSGRGWSPDDLDKLAAANMLRVLREAEKAASEPMWPGSEPAN